MYTRKSEYDHTAIEIMAESYKKRLKEAEDRVSALEDSMAEMRRKQQNLEEDCDLLEEDLEELRLDDDAIEKIKIAFEVRRRETENMWKRFDYWCAKEKSRDDLIQQKTKENDTKRKQLELKLWEENLTKVAQIVQSKIEKLKDAEHELKLKNKHRKSTKGREYIQQR